MKVARRFVEFKDLRGDLDRAFQHVQLGADREHLEQRCLGAHLACKLRVALARGIARAHQQAAGLRRSQGVHQLPAQGAQCGRMHQQHALPRKPDAAVARRKVHQAAQIDIGRQRGQGGGRHRRTIDKKIDERHRV